MSAQRTVNPLRLLHRRFTSAVRRFRTNHAEPGIFEGFVSQQDVTVKSVIESVLQSSARPHSPFGALQMPMSASDTDGNETLSIGELLDFAVDLDVLADSGYLVGKRASTAKTRINSAVPKIAHRLMPATPMAMTHVDNPRALLPPELTDTTTSDPAPDMRLAEPPLALLPLSDDDESSLYRVANDLENGADEPAMPLHLQQSSLQLRSMTFDGDFGLDSAKTSSSREGRDGLTNAAEQEISMTKKKKTSSQRQRGEIAYLRARVRELERVLATIKHEVLEADLMEGAVTTLPRGSVYTWVATAKRQLQQKNRAEYENALLRKKLSSEIRFAKSLDRVLRKHKPRLIELSTAEDSRVFEALTMRIGERARALEAVPDTQGFADGVRSPSSRPIVRTDDKEGMRIDLSTETALPFDFQKVADVAWARLHPLVSRLTCATTTAHTIDQTKDCFVSKQVRSLQLAGDVHRVTTHTVCKRVIQDNRVVVLWEMLVDARRPGSLQSVQVCLKGLGEILRGEVTADGSQYSRLRSAVSVVPHVMHDATNSGAGKGVTPKIPKRKSEMIGLLSELVIASHQQHTQACFRFIENALFDDLIHCRDGSG